MFEVLLAVHVLAAIVVVGPITVAASMFPRYARQAAADAGEGGARDAQIAATLHRICRVYTTVGLFVPAFGLAAGAELGVLTDPWLIVSVALTTVAALLLTLAILPRQRRLLALVPDAGTGGASDVEDGAGSGAGSSAGSGAVRTAAARLGMVTGIFNILWAVVVVLMIVRPGSTTGT